MVGPAPNGTDDTQNLKTALTNFLVSDFSVFKFRPGIYKISDTVLEAISVSNKHIDCGDAIIHDMRVTGQVLPLFRFETSSNVSIKNFKVYGHGDTVKKQAIVQFTSCSKFIVENIYGEDLVAHLIHIDPRAVESIYPIKGDCTDFRISNVESNHALFSTIFFSSLDHIYAPSAIRRGIVENVISKYNGQLVGGIYSDTSWAVGINCGEALNLLEDITFINCHSSYCAESGFHTEINVSVNNVKFIGCSAKFNGQKTTPQYGAGWWFNKGVSLIGCYSEDNANSPITIVNSSGNATLGNIEHGEIDLYDKDLGHIVYDHNHSYKIDDVKGEQFINPKLISGYGFYGYQAGETKINKRIPNFLVDTNGERYVQNDFRTNIFKIDKTTTFILTLDVMFDDATNLTDTFTANFTVTDEDGAIKGITGGTVTFLYSDLPVNKKVRLCRMVTVDKTDTYDAYNYACLSVNNAAKVRIYGLSIKRFDKNNVLMDRNLSDSGLDFHNSFAGSYDSGLPFIGDGLSQFKITQYLRQNWLVYDALYIGTEKNIVSHEFPIEPYDKIEVTLIAMSEVEITDSLGLRIRIGTVDKTIVPTTSKIKFTFVYDNSINTVSTVKLLINESGRLAGSTNIYFRVDSIKFL